MQSHPSSAPQPPQAESSPASWVGAALLTALAYTLVGLLALKLAIPPAYASPLYPSAGIALVAVMVGGWRMASGVALGALIINLVTASSHSPDSAMAWVLPSVIALGAGLQAVIGAALVQRFVGRHTTLGEPRDIGLFFLLGGALACTVSASIATTSLHLGGAVESSKLSLTWLTWWVGDTLGVLIAAPIALTLVGRPRAEWAPRRLTVGLTLFMATAFIAVGIAQVARWDDERAQLALERDADNAVMALRAQLREPLDALEAARGVFLASDDVTRAEFRRATLAWLQSGNLAAIGWSERLWRRDVPAFEARVQGEGQPAYRVFDRRDAASTPLPLRPEDEVVAIRYIEPEPGNAAALGVNANSIPAARAAIDAAARTGRPIATAGFVLTQDGGGTASQTGVVIYAALPDATQSPSGPSRLRGVVFVTLRIDSLMRNLLPEPSRTRHLCVLDGGPLASHRLLSGPPGCDAWTPAQAQSRLFTFAGREWELRVRPTLRQNARLAGANAWMFALVGLLAAAMLGALMLTVTGRTRRIEEAVHARTLALQTEVKDRQFAQMALQESEQRFRSILDHVPIGVVFVDMTGRVIQANPRFCEMLGQDEATVLSMTTADYTHPDDRTRDTELAEALIRNDFPMFRHQKRCVTRDGRTLWVQSTVSLLRDAQGRARHIVGAVEDITEHLRLQEAESARELAEASNRAKNDFLSRMSHELRTPLNAILGFAQLLEFDTRHPLASPQRPWVSQIQQAGWHLLEMINDVLDLSRIESGNLRLESVPLDLLELIDGALSMIRADADRRQISITLHRAPDRPRVLGDATRVRQILINLLSNAVKYNVDGGRVVVSTSSRHGTNVEVAITDTGVGMSQAQQAELFTPFNRLGRERSAAQGTGIGLVISKSLAELLGGSLSAASAPGPGSGMRFSLTLPSAGLPGAAAAPPQRQGKPALPPLPQYPVRRVVYIEDNETNVEVMRGVLARRPQIQMVACTDGASGLAEIRARPPDLLLLDMHLPDMSGLQLLQQLKGDPVTAGLPVLAVSADALPQQVEAALAAGAVAYLTKPVIVVELLAKLDELLASGGRVGDNS